MGGGACEVYPYEKGGVEQVLVILKGGHKTFPLFKRGARKVSGPRFLAILKVGHQTFPLFKRGGAQKVSGPRFSHFVAPSP